MEGWGGLPDRTAREAARCRNTNAGQPQAVCLKNESRLGRVWSQARGKEGLDLSTVKAPTPGRDRDGVLCLLVGYTHWFDVHGPSFLPEAGRGKRVTGTARPQWSFNTARGFAPQLCPDSPEVSIPALWDFARK